MRLRGDNAAEQHAGSDAAYDRAAAAMAAPAHLFDSLTAVDFNCAAPDGDRRCGRRRGNVRRASGDRNRNLNR